MVELTSIQMVDTFIKKSSINLLYVSRTGCRVCHALFPKVVELLKEFPKIELGHVDADDVEAIAGKLSIFTVPVLLLFVDGKEYMREARFVHIDTVRNKIKKIYEMRLNNSSI